MTIQNAEENPVAINNAKLTSHHFSAVLRAVDGRECWSESELLASVMESVAEAKLTPVAHLTTCFQPQGVSAVIILEESHVAVHLWPEKRLATVDIHVCDFSSNNEEKAIILAKSLGRRISAQDSLSHWKRLSMTE